MQENNKVFKEEKKTNIKWSGLPAEHKGNKHLNEAAHFNETATKSGHDFSPSKDVSNRHGLLKVATNYTAKDKHVYGAFPTMKANDAYTH